MRDSFDDKLKAMLNEDAAAPDAGLWDKIESGLDAERFASGVAQQLDALDPMPSDAVWAGIERQLHPGAKFKFPKAYYWSAAAALFCIVSIGIGLRNTEETITMPYIVSMKLPIMQAPEIFNTDAHISNPVNEVLPAQVQNRALRNFEQAPVITPSNIELQYALDEVIEIQLPDSMKLQPVQVYEELYAYQTEPISPELALIPEYVKPEKRAERPGLESAVNYVLRKVVGAKRAHLQIDESVKGKKKVWQVHFDSKLFSVSGAVPYGRIAESEIVKP
jgi:hypothetical protein